MITSDSRSKQDQSASGKHPQAADLLPHHASLLKTKTEVPWFSADSTSVKATRKPCSGYFEQ